VSWFKVVKLTKTPKINSGKNKKKKRWINGPLFLWKEEQAVDKKRTSGGSMNKRTSGGSMNKRTSGGSMRTSGGSMDHHPVESSE
jgi:hypothetical protein